MAGFGRFPAGSRASLVRMRPGTVAGCQAAAGVLDPRGRCRLFLCIGIFVYRFVLTYTQNSEPLKINDFRRLPGIFVYISNYDIYTIITIEK